MTESNAVKDTVTVIRDMASKAGLAIRSQKGIVTVTGHFDKGDKDAYTRMENDALRILARFRQTRAGSIWGSDSGSIGGAIALQTGNFVLNKSGCDMRLSRKFEA